MGMAWFARALLTVFLAASAPVLAVADNSWIRAIASRDVQALERLAARSVDVNRAAENGQTALMLAAAERNHRLLRILLERGAVVNAANSRGGTALMYAATAADVEAVEVLLARGARADTRAANGWTALTLAAARGFGEVVTKLLVHGADPNIADVYGWTPLMRAADANQAASVRALLASTRTRVNLHDENGHTALHHAAIQGSPDIVHLLIARGADIRAKDRSGRTPATLASLQGYGTVADMIRGAGER